MENFVLLAKDLFRGTLVVQSIFTAFFIFIQFFDDEQLLNSLLLVMYMGTMVAYIIKIITFNSEDKIIKIKIFYTLIYFALAMIIILLSTHNFYDFNISNMTNIFIWFMLIGWVFVSINCILYYMYDIKGYQLVEDDDYIED